MPAPPESGWSMSNLEYHQLLKRNPQEVVNKFILPLSCGFLATHAISEIQVLCERTGVGYEMKKLGGGWFEKDYVLIIRRVSVGKLANIIRGLRALEEAYA